jgi:uncharacterized protein
MVRLNLVSVGMVEDTGSVVLVLRAPDQARLLIMQVGLLEGRAIALEAEGVRAPRPLTHELALDVIERLGARIFQVQIREFKDQVFFANLVLEESGGRKLELDARPSDAIALALRAGAPIYATPQVMAEAGMAEESAEELTPDEDGEDEDEGHILH